MFVVKGSVIHNYGVIQRMKLCLSRSDGLYVVWSLALLLWCDERPGGQQCWLCFVAAVCHMCSRWFSTTQATSLSRTKAASLSTWSALFACAGTSAPEAGFECKMAAFLLALVFSWIGLWLAWVALLGISIDSKLSYLTFNLNDGNVTSGSVVA